MKRIIFIIAILFTCMSFAQKPKKNVRQIEKAIHQQKHNITRQKQIQLKQNERHTQIKDRRKISTKKHTTKSKVNNIIATKEIRGLQQQTKQIQKEIHQSEKDLSANKKDVENRLRKIITLDTEIEQHKKNINTISTDIKQLNGNIGIIKGQIKWLKAQFLQRRARFIRSMRYMARHRSIQDKLMFIFSAKSLTQMYRRLRFVREYAAYQRAQGELLKQKQLQIDEKHVQLNNVRIGKRNLLYKGRQEKAKIEQKKTAQQNIVTSLQKDQKVIQKVIAERQKKQQIINNQIDRLVSIEIAKARQRAIAEAKAKAAERAAEAKRRAAEIARKKAVAAQAARENARRIAEAKERERIAKKEAQERAARAEKERLEAQSKAEKAAREASAARKAAEAEATAKKARELKKAQQREAAAKLEEQKAKEYALQEKAKAAQAAREAEAARIAAERKAAVDRDRAAKEQAAAQRAENNSASNLMTSADRAATGSFANNRGRLPMPVLGRIITHFGTYNVKGLKNIRLNSSGIDIKASAGSPVRSVFKGEVSAISYIAGSVLVMIRHGAYISVYGGLGHVNVRRGQTVSTGQFIGTLDDGGILQFQLRKERAKLNPEAWIR